MKELIAKAKAKCYQDAIVKCLTQNLSSELWITFEPEATVTFHVTEFFFCVLMAILKWLINLNFMQFR